MNVGGLVHMGWVGFQYQCIRIRHLIKKINGCICSVRLQRSSGCTALSSPCCVSYHNADRQQNILDTINEPAADAAGREAGLGTRNTPMRRNEIDNIIEGIETLKNFREACILR